MKINLGLTYRGHAGHPAQSPWSRRTDKIIFPRFKFARARDTWTDYTTYYYLWVHHRWGSSFVRVVV